MKNKKQYKTAFVIIGGSKFWTKEFADNTWALYSDAYQDVINKFKLYPEAITGIIYSDAGTVIALKRTAPYIKTLLQ